MKRIATILGVAAAIGVFPSVGAAGNNTAQVAKVQIAKVQVAKPHVAQPQVAQPQVAKALRVSAARHSAFQTKRMTLNGFLALYPH